MSRENLSSPEEPILSNRHIAQRARRAAERTVQGVHPQLRAKQSRLERILASQANACGIQAPEMVIGPSTETGVGHSTEISPSTETYPSEPILSNRHIAQRARHVAERTAQGVHPQPRAKQSRLERILASQANAAGIHTPEMGIGPSTEIGVSLSTEIGPSSPTDKGKQPINRYEDQQINMPNDESTSRSTNWDKYIPEVPADDPSALNYWPPCAHWGTNWVKFANKTEKKDPSIWPEWPKKIVHFRHEEWRFKMEIDPVLYARIQRNIQFPEQKNWSDDWLDWDNDPNYDPIPWPKR